MPKVNLALTSTTLSVFAREMGIPKRFKGLDFLFSFFLFGHRKHGLIITLLLNSTPIGRQPIRGSDWSTHGVIEL